MPHSRLTYFCVLRYLRHQQRRHYLEDRFC